VGFLPDFKIHVIYACGPIIMGASSYQNNSNPAHTYHGVIRRLSQALAPAIPRMRGMNRGTCPLRLLPLPRSFSCEQVFPMYLLTSMPTQGLVKAR
jgi:hypothetical protein